MVMGYVFSMAKNGALGSGNGCLFSCAGVLLIFGKYRLALCGVDGDLLCIGLGCLLRKQGAWILCMLVLVAALLSRPNALTMIPVLFIVLASESTLQWRIKLIFILIFGLLGGYMLIYYMPYYWVHEGNSAHTHYWGFYPQQFHDGLFSGWPQWLNQAVSLLLLAVSKVIYSVGLRPSYAELSPWLVLARAWPGVLLLPGLIYGLWRGHWFDRIFLFFFLLPVYVGAAQERYLLAVTPLLLMWGIKAYSAIWRQCVYRDATRVTE